MDKEGWYRGKPLSRKDKKDRLEEALEEISVAQVYYARLTKNPDKTIITKLAYAECIIRSILDQHSMLIEDTDRPDRVKELCRSCLRRTSVDLDDIIKVTATKECSECKNKGNRNVSLS